MSPTLLLLGKASLLLAASLLFAPLLGGAPAAARHRLWTALFASLLALPLLAVALPALDVPVTAGRGAAAAVATNEGPILTSVAGAPAGEQAGERGRASASGAAVPAPGGSRVRTPPGGAAVRWRANTRSGAPAALLLVWLIGTACAIGALGLSLFRVRRLAAAADDVGDPAWRGAAATIGARVGMQRPPRLLVSTRVGTPMAGGVWRPVIFLPASSRAWSAERRDVVLAHEMVHLAWRDPLRHLVTRLALALYWFHPLAWIAARQGAIAREQAADEAVLALGTRRSAYARVLLDLAGAIPSPAITTAALPMVQRAYLERRLMTILNGDPRPATRRLLLVPVIGLTALTFSVAAVRLTPVTPSGARVVAQVSADPAPAPTLAQAHAPMLAPAAPARTLARAGIDRSSACGWDAGTGSSFSGSISTTTRGGTEIREQVGRRGNDRIIQQTFGDLRVCMVAEEAEDLARPSQLVGHARRLVLEARRGSTVQRLEVTQAAGRPSWQVNGKDRAFDAAAERWRDRMLALLDTTWEIATLHGQVSSLRGEISSIHGQRSSLQGEISSLRGEVSSMRGEMSSARGHESSLNGEISSFHGHLSSLHGAISSEQGAISSLNASRYDASDAERARIAAGIAAHEAQIKRIEGEIRDYGAEARVAAVEKERTAYDANGKVAAIEAQIKAFDLDGKVKAVEGRIKALDVEGKVAAIERQIHDLDADRRVAQLETRQQTELTRLEAAIAAIR